LGATLDNFLEREVIFWLPPSYILVDREVVLECHSRIFCWGGSCFLGATIDSFIRQGGCFLSATPENSGGQGDNFLSATLDPYGGQGQRLLNATLD
jgi:hypothetical protein